MIRNFGQLGAAILFMGVSPVCAHETVASFITLGQTIEAPRGYTEMCSTLTALCESFHPDGDARQLAQQVVAPDVYLALGPTQALRGALWNPAAKDAPMSSALAVLRKTFDASGEAEPTIATVVTIAPHSDLEPVAVWARNIPVAARNAAVCSTQTALCQRFYAGTKAGLPARPIATLDAYPDLATAEASLWVQSGNDPAQVPVATPTQTKAFGATDYVENFPLFNPEEALRSPIREELATFFAYDAVLPEAPVASDAQPRPVAGLADIRSGQGASVSLTLAEQKHLLDRINRHVNSRVRQQLDNVTYGVDELWRPSGDDRHAKGDCEDLAIEKRVELLAAHFPADRLFFAVVYGRQIGLHTVLVARLDQGDMVLDSRTFAIQPWTGTPYTWLAVETPGNPSDWRSLSHSAA